MSIEISVSKSEARDKAASDPSSYTCRRGEINYKPYADAIASKIAGGRIKLIREDSDTYYYEPVEG